MKIETYYDLGCAICGCHRSTDFCKGMPFEKWEIQKHAPKEGWRYSKKTNSNYCPNCAEKAKDKAFETICVNYTRGDIEDECARRGIRIVNSRSVMENKLIDAITLEILDEQER